MVEAFRRYIAPALRTLFGQFQWTPPAWLPRAAGTVRRWTSRGVAWLDARRAANPTGFWLTTFATLAVMIGGYAGWQWYEHRPEPYYLQVTVNRPGPTAFEANALPDTLNLQFSGSAARLGAIGKNVLPELQLLPSLKVYGSGLVTRSWSLRRRMTGRLARTTA